MSIQELAQVLPAPQSPVDAAGERSGWLAVEAELKTALPEDYKAFIETYGSGTVDGFLRIFNPFAVDRNVNLMSRMPEMMWALNEVRPTALMTPGLRLYPETNGALPFGVSHNGDFLMWVTVGRPDD